VYSIKREYESESEDQRPKKVVEITPKKYQGIGPTTKEGIPIVLRSVSILPVYLAFLFFFSFFGSIKQFYVKTPSPKKAQCWKIFL
jgi:hypothetical protein